MRVIASSLRAALIIAALFWGNCLTCPQALMAQSQQRHQCCHKHKQDSAACQTQALQQFVKADPARYAPVFAAPAIVVVVPSPTLAVVSDFASLPDAAEHAPPDLLSLHSSFRI
jgi:hypothetical protein